MQTYVSFMRRRDNREAGFAWLPMLLGILLVAAGFGAGYAVITKQQEKRQQGVVRPTPSLSQTTTPEFSASPSPSELQIPAVVPTPTPAFTVMPSQMSPPTHTPMPTPAPTRLPALGTILWHERNAIPDQQLWELPYPFNDTSGDSHAAYYEVGTFVGGAYGNGSLIILEAPCTEMCFRNNFFLFASSKGRFTFIVKHSDTVYPDNGLRTEQFTVDDAFTIPELDFPKNLVQPGTRITMELDLYRRGWFDARGLEKTFTHATYGDAYTDAPSHSATSGSFITKQNGIYFHGPDSMERVYALKPDILIDGVPQITWNDGSRNTAKYEFTDIGGCGARNYASVIDTNIVNPAQDFTTRGMTLMDDAVFELRDTNHPMLKNVYENQYYVYGEGKQKIPYAEFITKHPVFFWRDSLDRLLKFQHADFVPLAECAKPVIYLYPEQKTRVRIRIEPQGGLSYTEPLYNPETGWVVDADPSGVLMDVASHKTFPYLFWEGRGGIYEQPHKGFVVERDRVHTFLTDALAQLGLTDQEIGDFIIYWEPYMRSAPYYFITFLGTEEMDRIAPLSVEPEPDTVIRILIDFSPLASPVSVKPMNLSAPQRSGFTVVEWGGVRR